MMTKRQIAKGDLAASREDLPEEVAPIEGYRSPVGHQVTIRRIPRRRGLGLPLILALVLAIASAGSAVAAPSSPNVAGITSLAEISQLSHDAYIWGLAPEFMYRFGKYNELTTSPVNTLAYGQAPAAWNNSASNAGDSSVLYISGIMDVTHTDLVYTVPSTEWIDPIRRQPAPYQVSQIFDDFINVFANPGTRTTPESDRTSYLLVGPNSKYSHMKTATIKGQTLPVIASPTNRCELLVRILAETLTPPSDPESTPNVYKDVVQKYALNTLQQFVTNGYQPVYPKSYANYVPTKKQVQKAASWFTAPTDDASEFFTQIGESLKLNPLPTQSTGLSGIPSGDLPSYIVPQPGATGTYYPASAGQQSTLAAFEPIGLTAKGWKEPTKWGRLERGAMQAGVNRAAAEINFKLSQLNAGPATNYWGYENQGLGTYENNPVGYLYRAVGVVAGGFPNLPIDGFYAEQILDSSGNAYDGNDTYSITFSPPAGPGTLLPVEGTLPPLAINPSTGKPYGFWSLTVYQPDPSSSAPWLSQTSVLNTAYTTVETDVISVDAAASTLTVAPSAVNTLKASSAVVFDSGATSYGLVPGQVYYVADTPTQSGSNVIISLTTQWVQALSPNAVPIQAAPSEPTGGKAGPSVSLTVGTGPLHYGIVQPVSQLGSSEVGTGDLMANADGSYTIWLSPSLPVGVDPHNWIPTPSTSYLQGIYGNAALKPTSTAIELMIRMYYSQPGNLPPSILPCPAGIPACDGGDGLPASYVFPALIIKPSGRVV